MVVQPCIATIIDSFDCSNLNILHFCVPIAVGLSPHSLIRELRRFTPSSKDRLYIYVFFFGNRTSLTIELQVSTWTLNIGVKLPVIIYCGCSFERVSETFAV